MSILAINGGNGVLLHPFKKHLIGNIEPRSVFHTPNHVQWKKNFSIPFDINLRVLFPKKDVGVIIGAPDCGHSSVLSYSRAKKLGNPQDNESLTGFIRSIKNYEPDFFMMENLPKLIEAYPEIIDLFESFGYNLVIHKEPVSYWGNSQVNRKRLIIVGINKKYKFNKLKKYFNITTDHKLSSSYELIGDLGVEENFALGHVRELDDWRLPMYVGKQRNISVKEARGLWMQYDTRKWPVSNSNMKNQPGVYRNLDTDYPMTVRKQSRQFREDGYLLTPREMARIQGIPDTFKLHFEEERRLYYINKMRVSVTKCPPYEIGEWFNKCLTKIKYYG